MEKGITMEESRVLDVCRDIEYLCEEIYRRFAELFWQDTEMEALWRKTADEERNHAHQFELAIKAKKDLLQAVSIDSYTAVSTAKFVRTVLEGVKKSPPSRGDALQLAIKLEERLEGLHLHFVGEFTDKSIHNMFTSMMAADHRHVESLVKAHASLIKRKSATGQ